MTLKRTPGPWEYDPKGPGVIVAPGDGLYEGIPIVAHIEPWDNGEEEGNARLIAAAPALLEALIDAEAILAQLQNQDYPVHIELATARNAIALATGKKS